MSSRGIELKQPDELRLMRQAGLVVASALAAVTAEARPGVTTAELDGVAADVIRSAGALPSFLGYGAVDGVGGFAGVTCLSVNDEVVHGVPGDTVLAPGDLLSIDCGAIVQGWHGDSAVSLLVPGAEPEPALVALSDTTRWAMWHGIAAARTGGHVRDITAAVQEHVQAQPAGYGIVEDYVGHGIGSAMHQPPDVPNRLPQGLLSQVRGRGPRLVEGMALAVEPMLTLGDPATHVLADDWTVVTDDGRPACHWEHTVALTAHGLWVLTAEDGGEEVLGALGAPYGPLA